jgi:hypothetical protein
LLLTLVAQEDRLSFCALGRNPAAVAMHDPLNGRQAHADTGSMQAN